MITRVESVNAKSLYPTSLKKQEKSSNNITNTVNNSTKLFGVPRSYISFRGKTFSDLKLTDDAKALAIRAENIAKDMNHSEITPMHVIAAGIAETEDAIRAIPTEVLDTGAIASLSALNKIVNNSANENMIANKENRDYFLQSLEEFKAINNEALGQLPKAENNSEVKALNLSEDFFNFVSENTEKALAIDSYMLLGCAMNNCTENKMLYPSEFLKDFISLTYYKNDDEIKKNYMKEYNTRAIDVWNKLALGSNLFVTCSDEREADRLASSIINTIDAEKHGDVTSQNTLIYKYNC